MKLMIGYEEAKDMEDVQFIDVRSPGEFHQASLPGAVNIPLYTDEERHRLGLTYKEEGTLPARVLGLEMVSPRLPRLVREIREACGDKTPVLYCWRGGSRSESVAAILHLMRIPVYRLQGGYKGFRRYVHQRLKEYKLNTEMVVLHGLTGVGKTRILHILKEEGYPVLDLEGLALHRGSVFGSLGLEKPRSQKDFEGLLLAELDLCRNSPYLLVEGEGQRIGPLFVPSFLVEGMGRGRHILLEASPEERVQRILNEYIRDEEAVLEGARESLSYIKRRLSRETYARIRAALDEGDVRAAVRDLCLHYYDRLYLDSRKENGYYAASIDAEDMAGAVTELKGYLARSFSGGGR